MNDITKARLQELSKKIGKDFSVLEAQFNDKYAQSKALYTGKTDAWHEERARKVLMSAYTEAARGQSVALDVKAFYVGPAVDYNANDRASKEQAFKDNQIQAINSGQVSSGLDGFEKGTPLDTKEWFVEPSPGNKGSKNPNYKKPLKPFWQRRVIGYAVRFGEQTMKLFVGTMRDAVALKEVPKETFTGRFNVRAEDTYTISVTSGSKTEFAPSTNPIFNGWDEAKCISMLEQSPAIVKYDGVEEWFTKNKSNKGAVLVLKADLITKSDEPSSNGTYRIVLGSVEEPDGPSVTAFIDEAMYAKIKKDRTGTELIGIGNITLGQDFATGTMTALNFNPMNIYVTMAISDQEIDMKNVKA